MEEKNFEREVLDRLIKIEMKIDSMDKLKEQVYKNKDALLELNMKDEQQQKQIDEMLEEQRWLKRTVISSIVVAIITLIFGAIKIGFGL